MTGRSRKPRSAFRAGVLAAALAASFAATAAQGQELVTTIGAEQLVAATGDQPALVYDDQGRGVITWVEAGTPSAPASVRARRLSGETLGAPFQVSAPSTAISPADPRVAMDAQGGFVVVWSANEVHGQLFRADARPRGGLLTLTPRNVGGFHPEVAMAPDGRFALAWEQSHWDPMRAVRLATFTSRGTRLGRAQTMPAIGTMANLVGAVSASPQSVAIGWTEFTPCPSNPIDPVSAVSTFSWSMSLLRGVDRLANDNPCVDGPQVLAMPSSDFGPLGIFVGRRYSIQRFSRTDGTRIGPRTNVAEFPACPGGTACERVKTVAGDPRGRFVFIWERFENGVYNLVAELYGREGAKRVERFPINAHPSATEERPAAALTSDGTLVVTWHREGEGVLMRQFRIQ
jgi:hypothetical protein